MAVTHAQAQVEQGCHFLLFDRITNDLKSEGVDDDLRGKGAVASRPNPLRYLQQWHDPATAMPREKARGNFDDPCLLDLPSYALNLLVSKSRGFYFRHPLLRVGRAGRDAVLQGTKNASLQLRPEDTAETVAALTRMLSRVCATAAAGLRLHIRSPADEPERSSDTERDADALLATLLEPGLQQPDGWPKVHSLELAIPGAGATAGHIIGLVFPELRHLGITGADLGGGALITSALLCKHLTSLEMSHCSFGEIAEGSVKSVLSRMANLKSLLLAGSMQAALLSVGLTQLTSLSLHAVPEQLSKLVPLALSIPHLRSISLRESRDFGVTLQPEVLLQLMTGCPFLEEFDIDAAVCQQGLDILLSAGTQLRKVEVGDIQILESRADKPCSWKELSLNWDVEEGNEVTPGALLLAYLPMKALNSFWPTGLQGSLELPFSVVPVKDLPDIVHRAALNLAESPAWHGGSEYGVTLKGDPLDRVPEGCSFSESLRVALLDALAPLHGTGEFTLSVANPEFRIGQPEIKAIGRSLHDKLITMAIWHCMLEQSAWPVMMESLPALTTLELGKGVHGAMTVADIALFASRTSRQLTLRLWHEMYDQLDAGKVQDALKGWGITNLTVISFGGDDM